MSSDRNPLDVDTRVTCLGCRQGQAGRCLNPKAAGLATTSWTPGYAEISRAFAELKQRCAGYLPRVVRSQP